ncbi:MAG TPA: zinc ribbon domain-containing protein [bacterium (Candidatus Stahlbacteria)]|nr:zinc ribbon domain-containing protein [Candidatus Stahlbacteria bacterium]
MPIYEYQCQKCRAVFEVLQKTMKTETEPVCPHCSSKQVERLISRPGILKIEWGSATSSSTTCCGRSEPCDTPPCSDGTCKRD